MTFQFRLSRYLAYLGLSAAIWGIAIAITSLGLMWMEIILVGIVAAIAIVFYLRTLEALAQKHYLKNVQPIFLTGNPQHMLETAEALLSVRANGPSDWQSFYIEIHCMNALLQNGRVAEAKRRLVWAEHQYANLFIKDNLSKYRLEAQRIVQLLAEQGEGFGPLLDNCRKAYEQMRLELQTSYAQHLAFYEASAAILESNDEAAWTDYQERFLLHEKHTIRQTCRLVLEGNTRRQNGLPFMDPSALEGDLLPQRRHPIGTKRILEIFAVILAALAGGLTILKGMGAAYFADGWYWVLMIIGLVAAVFLTIRVKFHEGISFLILLCTAIVSLLF